MLEPARIGLGMLHAQCPVPLFSDVIRSDELSLLRNERIEVRENGKPRIKITYLDFKTNLRIAIEMFCRVFKLDRDSSLYDSDGWDRLIQGEAIRNRIMHPKTIQSIAIGDEELPILQGGGQWIYDTYGELLSSVGGSLKIASEDFERWLNTLQDDLLKQVLLLFEKSKSS